MGSVNRAGLLALRTGHWECAKLSLSNVIMEDDSWSAAGSSKPPWRLTDEVEGVIELTTKLNVCFAHFLSSANDVSDLLAEEGVVRSSLSIIMPF